MIRILRVSVLLYVALATVAYADWCGFTDETIARQGINPNSSCRLPLADGELVFIEATQRYQTNIRGWFTGAENTIPGVQLRKCLAKTSKVLSGDTLLTAPKMRLICSKLQAGEHEVYVAGGVRAHLLCDNYQAAGLRLADGDRVETCELPLVLTQLPRHAKIKDQWFGEMPAALQKKQIDPAQACQVEVSDPTYPEPLQFAFIWGRQACHALNYYADRHSCGWFAHHMGLHGKRMSDYMHRPRLNELCQAQVDGAVRVSQPFLRSDHPNRQDLSDLAGYVECRNGEPQAVKLAIKPLVGDTVEKRCAMPDAILSAFPDK